MKFFSFGIMSIIGLLLVASFGTAQAASLTPQQTEAKECLSEANLPPNVSPVKQSDIPAAYSDWPSVSAGIWRNMDKRICHVVIVEKITPNGEVDFVYFTKGHEYTRFVGIIKEVMGIQQMNARLGFLGYHVTYSLNKNDSLLEGFWKAPDYFLTGTFFKLAQE